MRERMPLPAGIAAAAATCGAAAAVGTVAGSLVLVGAVTIGAAGLLFLRIAVSHARLARRLRACSTEVEVAGTRLRVGSLGGTAFVAGLARPSIFCDRALLDALDEGEVRAVTLHERAHQLARDPLRNVLIAVLTPLLACSSRGREWLAGREAAREIAADRYALAHGAARHAIASALMKVAPAGGVPAAGFTPAVELRLRALLGDEMPARPRTWRAVVLGGLAGVVACLALFHPVARIAEAAWGCCAM